MIKLISIIMEFILNNKKFSIVNQELYINYLLVDSYFRKAYSKYDYDIKFDFIDPLHEKDRISLEDIMEGTEVLEELIEREEISFLKPDFIIDQHVNGNFQIRYQDLEFSNIAPGEAIPLLIALNTLLDARPVISLSQIEEELNHFIESFRKYGDPQ